MDELYVVLLISGLCRYDPQLLKFR